MSSDIIKDISEGATRGIIKEGKDSIKNSIKIILEKLKNRKLGFVQDPLTIKRVIEQRKIGEVKQYKMFVKDKEIIQVIIMGLTLRKLEKDKNYLRVRNLRTNILIKYKLEGLHIAQAIQNGILSRYVVNLLEQGFSINDVKLEVKNFLGNIEKHICFVSSNKKVQQIVEEVKTKINAHNPSIFVLSGAGNAMKITIESHNLLLKENLPYIIEKYSNPIRELYFFNRNT